MKKLAQLKKTWTVQNFPLIVMMTLYVAVYLMINPIQIPTEVLAYEKEEEVDTLDMLLKQYTSEEYESMYAEAEIRATRRMFEELGEKVLELNPNN